MNREHEAHGWIETRLLNGDHQRLGLSEYASVSLHARTLQPIFVCNSHIFEAN